jgi:hypothetical protein
MGKSRSKWRKEGYEAFCPGERPDDHNPYRIHYDPYPHECWTIGWAEAMGEHDRAQELANTGYDWEDPECDIIAAVKQLQDMFDGMLRSNL